MKIIYTTKNSLPAGLTLKRFPNCSFVAPEYKGDWFPMLEGEQAARERMIQHAAAGCLSDEISDRRKMPGITCQARTAGTVQILPTEILVIIDDRFSVFVRGEIVNETPMLPPGALNQFLSELEETAQKMGAPA